MVIKYFGPDDKRGVYWPPYTAQERREMEASMFGPRYGPVVMVPSRTRGGPTNRQTEETNQSEQEAPEKAAE